MAVRDLRRCGLKGLKALVAERAGGVLLGLACGGRGRRFFRLLGKGYEVAALGRNDRN